MLSIAAFALVSALAASAADIQVNVGANDQLVFDPTQVTAQPGDNIHFQFQSKNHSVTQSTFAAPCAPLSNGIDSGFMPINLTDTTHPVWTFTVTDTTPLWFFCAQTVPAVHCAAGMVFAVNPTADKSFQQFQATAKGTASASNSTSTGSVTGVIPAPSSLPGVTGSGAAVAPSQSGFVTSAAAGAGTGTGTGAAAAATSSATSPNGAIGLSSAGAFSLVSMFAAVAGLML